MDVEYIPYPNRCGIYFKKRHSHILLDVTYFQPMYMYFAGVTLILIELIAGTYSKKRYSRILLDVKYFNQYTYISRVRFGFN